MYAERGKTYCCLNQTERPLIILVYRILITPMVLLRHLLPLPETLRVHLRWRSPFPKPLVGRLYSSTKNVSKFYLNPGPALVPTFDPNNYATLWGFCEVTYNNKELFGNSIHVDFIGLPIALDLVDQSNNEQ